MLPVRGRLKHGRNWRDLAAVIVRRSRETGRGFIVRIVERKVGGNAEIILQKGLIACGLCRVVEFGFIAQLIRAAMLVKGC